MNVFRITNFNLVGRGLYSNYMICSTFYKTNSLYTQVRTLGNSKNLYYAVKKPIEEAQKPMVMANRKLHFSPKQSTSVENITDQVISIFKDIRLQDVKEAPEPVFWYSTAGLIPFIGPPLSFLIFGYSPWLATMQLVYAATLCSFAGGMKWGYALHCTEHQPTWENLGWAIVPQMLGLMSLLMPQFLGFLLVTSGIAISTFVDLTSTNYPNWFKAIRLAVTVPAILSLLLTLIIYLFH